LVLLAIDGLSITFGGLVALNGFSADIEEGAIFALIGPNGAGKTTVFNILTGLYRPTGGRAVIGGDDLVRLAPHEIARRGVARTFQNTEVFRQLTALENVLVGEHLRLTRGVLAGLLGLPAVWREETAARARALVLLERVGLADVTDVEAGSLPLGRQKRLEIARALALGPRLLLLDEPVGGLSVSETQEIMTLIKSLRDHERLTVMLVEHNMDVVMRISDRVAVLHHGAKLAEGTPHEVQRNPAVIDAYLGGDSPP
jgi:branched-chain amino acid transport system ATP-binding protein